MYSKIRQSHICIIEINEIVKPISSKWREKIKWNMQTLR